MNENNVGKKMESDGVILEIVSEERAKQVIKRYNLKVKKTLLIDPTTEAATLTDVASGKVGYLMLLPKSNGAFYMVNKDVVDYKIATTVLLSLY